MATPRLSWRKHTNLRQKRLTKQVLSTREKVAEARSVEPSQLKFVYSGKVLQDDKTLQEYKMKDGDSVIYMISAKKTPAPTPAAVAAPVPSEPSAVSQSGTSASLTNTTDNNGPTPVPAEPKEGATSGSESASAGPSSGPSDFAVGQERETAIQYMLELGFPRSDIEAAMRAAFNNPHRAVEYLLSEIPASARSTSSAPSAVEASAPSRSDTSANAANASETTGDLNPEHSSSASGNMFDDAAAIGRDSVSGPEGAGLDNELALLNEAITSNPELLQPLLQRLAESNPQIAQLIAQDPEGFVQRLMENDFEIEEGEGDEGEDMEGGLVSEAPEGAVTLTLTELELNAITRLCELGFDRNLVIQVYLACDKNEEVAADILFRDT